MVQAPGLEPGQHEVDNSHAQTVSCISGRRVRRPLLPPHINLYLNPAVYHGIRCLCVISGGVSGTGDECWICAQGSAIRIS